MWDGNRFSCVQECANFTVECGGKVKCSEGNLIFKNFERQFLSLKTFLGVQNFPKMPFNELFCLGLSL